MDAVKLFFAGDFASMPSTSLITVSDELKSLIQSCDLRLVNFEFPLKPEAEMPEQQYPRFYNNDDAPAFLRNLGFELMPIANNHTFDYGVPGFLKTLEVLGDQCFGAGTYDEAYQVKIVEIAGVKLGFIALSYAAYTGVFDDVSDHDGYGCAYINDLKVGHVILDAKKHVDYLFVLPHDGIEYLDVPLPEVKARYRDFIDYGADGVIGGHPHCPQGWETYKGKPIFYCLGNFFFSDKEDPDFHFEESERPHWYEGLCLILEIKDGNISFDVFNVKNVDNRRMEIDRSQHRVEHNKKILEYLSDQAKYDLYLQSKLITMNYQKFTDRSFHPKTLRLSVKRLFECWSKHIIGKDFTDDFALKTLLRNDTRRNALIRALKKQL